MAGRLTIMNINNSNGNGNGNGKHKNNGHDSNSDNAIVSQKQLDVLPTTPTEEQKPNRANAFNFCKHLLTLITLSASFAKDCLRL